MGTLDRLAGMLPEGAASELARRRDTLTEIRLRAGRPVQLVWPEGDLLSGRAVDAPLLRDIAAALTDYSLYARESELAQGFFTMGDGCRVGVCGRFAGEGRQMRLTDVGSVCVRVARALPGCADTLLERVMGPHGPRSALVLSPPGMGKTTMLRDVARQLSEEGLRVGVADERHELAACHMGAPTLDVGPRTDVMDGCPRPQAIRRLMRCMSPDVIVADEIGGEEDALAIADASRCGVAIVASAHARSLSDAAARPWLRSVLSGGSIDIIALLGDLPGEIREIREVNGRDAACRRA